MEREKSNRGRLGEASALLAIPYPADERVESIAAWVTCMRSRVKEGRKRELTDDVLWMAMSSKLTADASLCLIGMEEASLDDKLDKIQSTYTPDPSIGLQSITRKPRENLMDFAIRYDRAARALGQSADISKPVSLRDGLDPG